MSDPTPTPTATTPPDPSTVPFDTYDDGLGDTWTLMQDKATFTITGSYTYGPVQVLGTYDSAKALCDDRIMYDLPTPSDVQSFADGCLTAYQKLTILSGQANDLELSLEKVNGFINTVVTICNDIALIPIPPFSLFKDVAAVVSGVEAATTEAAQKVLEIVHNTTWQMAIDADALHDAALKTKKIPADGVSKIEDAYNLMKTAAQQIAAAVVP